MSIAVVLPPGWKDDLGVLTALCALHGRLPEQRVTFHVASTMLGPTVELAIVPISQRTASWASAWLEQGDALAVLYLSDLTGIPQLWTQLIPRAAGILLPEREWLSLLHAARPRLPALWVPPDDLSPEPSLHPTVGTAQPYLLTWAPANAPSIGAIAEAFACLACSHDDLQLVVIGGADRDLWRRSLRAYGLWHRAWVLDDSAYAQAYALTSNALAVIAPIPPAGRCVGLLTSLARTTALRCVVLEENGEQGPVSVKQGVPIIGLDSLQAPQALAAAIEVLLDTDVHALGARWSSLRDARSSALLRESEALAAFLARVVSEGGSAQPTPMATDLVAFYTNLV
ncbi:MAG: hypothetical protein ABFD20_06410, partial [Anaerolineales bacterium]